MKHIETCPKCGDIKEQFIVDYDDNGKEYTFCGNCNNFIGYGDLSGKDRLKHEETENSI
ncbi:hypothetical protein [Ruminiclostridium papyrosolvens]|uniref:Uncharacterized protein n=1 Tax=Ruminiclostridium papyrosolvens C7 TaxID=1330534 RepID=U4R431_9FIRM|nr:hypothetical protein [Ruminiclostridium papyrosolvens]EPR12480.1 hypothetical protein L323_07960 [Ruminiclostridium papyrosolvens C7]